MAISDSARLLRGFAVDFLTAHNPKAAEWVMDPAYRLSISGHVFDGRDDAYLPVTIAQLDLFPGLCVTVHDVVLAPGAAAMRFTEHGVSARQGQMSSWGGITLFRIENGRLLEGWAEEDYFARKRQLKSGSVDMIQPPHPGPWDQPVLRSDSQTETILRKYLTDLPAMLGGAEEISSEGPPMAQLIVPKSLEISALFTAGSRATFHAVLSGEYGGGYADIDPSRIGAPVTLPVAAIVDIDDGAVTRLQICGDRLGLHRHLINLT